MQAFFHLFKITTFSPPFSEFSGLDCVIVPSGCVHENKPDTQVVRGEVEAHNVGATRFSAIFNVPPIAIVFAGRLRGLLHPRRRFR